MKFADTSWWLAWSMPDDGHHRAAVEATRALGSREQLLTTNLVVGETWTAMRRFAGHAAAVDFFDRVRHLADESRLRVHRVTDEEELQAWRWLRRHDERSYSWVDATSFEVMRARRLREAFAFDRDFAAAGFVTLG